MSKDNGMFKCEVCGYVHQGESAPNDCPVCGAPGEIFELLEIVAEPRNQAKVWQCGVCDYVHQDAQAPDECPVCGAKREHFEPFEMETATATDSDIGKLVIIGGGIAGMTVAEQARSTSADVAITLISKETCLPYLRLIATPVTGESILSVSPY